MVVTEGPLLTSQHGAYVLHTGLVRLHALMLMDTPTRPGNHMHVRTHTQRNNTFCFSTATIIRERASMLCYTSIVSPVSARYNTNDCVCVSFFSCCSYYIDLHRHTTHLCVFIFENQIGACFILGKKPRSSSNSEMPYLIVSTSALKNADVDTICEFFSWTRR